jgi:ankyrin repeat protein
MCASPVSSSGGAELRSPSQQSGLPPPNFAATASLDNIKQIVNKLSLEDLKAWVNSTHVPLINGRNMSPLAAAVEAHTPENDKTNIVEFLIDECGASPNFGGINNWTPVYRASTEKGLSPLQSLLVRGGDVNIPNSDGSMPLHRMVDRGCEAGVNTLLSKGADVNSINCFGSPLAYAAKNGNTTIAKSLLDSGADPNLVNDPLDATPVELAINNHKDETKELLTSRGGLVNVPESSKSHTHLSLLVQKGDSKAILDSFTKGETDKYGRSTAHYCAHHGKVVFLQQMSNSGNIDLPENKGRTPLCYAAIRGQKETVDYLIGHQGNCSLTSRDKQGYTPLMWSCQFNQEKIAKSILERSKDKDLLSSVLSTVDNFGWTALHKAAQVGNLPLVVMFVEEYGVDYTQKIVTEKGDGRTALDLAENMKNTSVIEYLKSLAFPSPQLGDLNKKA